jgi:hypothetical protein
LRSLPSTRTSSCSAVLPVWALGSALAGSDRILLGVTIPLLGVQFALMIGLRFGLAPWLSCLTVLPFREQLNMELEGAANLPQAIAIYFFLSAVFLLTVLAFVPVGQVCGRLMAGREKLRAYGLNLLGSLSGDADGDGALDSVRIDFTGCVLSWPLETDTVRGTVDVLDPTRIVADHSVEPIFNDLARVRAYTISGKFTSESIACTRARREAGSRWVGASAR